MCRAISGLAQRGQLRFIPRVCFLKAVLALYCLAAVSALWAPQLVQQVGKGEDFVEQVCQNRQQGTDMSRLPLGPDSPCSRTEGCRQRSGYCQGMLDPGCLHAVCRLSRRCPVDGRAVKKAGLSRAGCRHPALREAPPGNVPA